MSLVEGSTDIAREAKLGDFGDMYARARALQNYTHSAQKIGKQRICGRALAVSGGPQRRSWPQIALMARPRCWTGLCPERGIEPHVTVFEKSARKDGTFSREDFSVMITNVMSISARAARCWPARRARA